jgi:hypothetical protein
MVRNRHGENRFRSYRQIHETVLSKFKSCDFVDTDTLEFNSLPYGIRLSGEIACLGEIVITVDKFLTILSGCDDEALVKTKWYSYNASVRGWHNIIRFDNQDDDFKRPGHLDEHHQHVFDWRTGAEKPGSPYWVGEENWGTLGNFLQLMQDWYWQNCSSLSNPDKYPNLGLR